MPPKQIKHDPEDRSQESPDLSTIQPMPGTTASPGTSSTLGQGLPNLLSSHSLPVIHEAGEPYFSSHFPGLQNTTHGLTQYPFPFPNISGIGNISSAHQFALNPSYSTGYHDMNNMSRTVLPSGRNAGNQGLGGSGTGRGINKRPAQQRGQTGIATNQAVNRAAFGMGVNLGQNSNQNQGLDLTGMDYNADNSMGLYGSTLNSGVDPDCFASNNYNPFLDFSGGAAQQEPQGQGYGTSSPAIKFDPDLVTSSPDYIASSPQYESFGDDEYETKPDPRSIIRPEHGTPTPGTRKRRAASLALADVSPATANTSSPVGSSPTGALEQGRGSGSGSGRQAANTNNPPPAYRAHVPPNRIPEAGPVTHPDPEWRPYGVNHWHVFLREPTTLKYLSSTEIKDIREHCYELAAKAAEAANDGDDGDDQSDENHPKALAEGSPYTTADAQAVWKHCDAYVRRRSQVRNNQAARRSRLRKDAETRYWKAKALEHGCPDHEFEWNLVDESPPTVAAYLAQQGITGGGSGGGGSSSSSRAANAGGAEGGGGGAVLTRARARAQQQQQGDGQGGQARGQVARGGGGGGRQAADRRASSSSVARPEYNFNQPVEHDEDDKTLDNNFDAFIGDY